MKQNCLSAMIDQHCRNQGFILLLLLFYSIKIWFPASCLTFKSFRVRRRRNSTFSVDYASTPCLYLHLLFAMLCCFLGDLYLITRRLSLKKNLTGRISMLFCNLQQIHISAGKHSSWEHDCVIDFTHLRYRGKKASWERSTKVLQFIKRWMLTGGIPISQSYFLLISFMSWTK